MANRLISEMGLSKSISNIFRARNIRTAKEPLRSQLLCELGALLMLFDSRCRAFWTNPPYSREALSMTEFELMELLDVGLAEVEFAIAHISEMVSPAHETVLTLLERQIQYEQLNGHLPTRLKGLDKALCGGIPFGVVTELVGPSGIGKTQLCLKLALLASLPASYGGLDGHVIYIDLESKFSSKRLIEMGSKSFPEVFYRDGMAQQMAGRILVLRPGTLSEFTESLQRIKVSLLQHQVKLLIIDSMAALVSEEQVQMAPGRHLLAWHISFLKSLAEFSRIPVVVTNQVRSQIHNDVSQFSFQHMAGRCEEETAKEELTVDHHHHLVAALGIHWAHAVSIRLVLEGFSGHRFIKIAKSPISPPLRFPFEITSAGICTLDDAGTEVSGPEINSIHCEGHSDIISNSYV